MKPKVYLETSIFSFYFDGRSSPLIVAQREATREWWELWRDEYECYTSSFVLKELGRGSLPHRRQALALAQTLPELSITPEVPAVIDEYIAAFVMPRDPAGDAAHLAIASLNHCAYLLTWNCQHLANARKFSHIEYTNRRLGLPVPLLVTPRQLGVEQL